KSRRGSQSGQKLPDRTPAGMARKAGKSPGRPGTACAPAEPKAPARLIHEQRSCSALGGQLLSRDMVEYPRSGPGVFYRKQGIGRLGRVVSFLGGYGCGPVEGGGGSDARARRDDATRDRTATPSPRAGGPGPREPVGPCGGTADRPPGRGAVVDHPTRPRRTRAAAVQARQVAAQGAQAQADPGDQASAGQGSPPMWLIANLLMILGNLVWLWLQFRRARNVR